MSRCVPTSLVQGLHGVRGSFDGSPRCDLDLSPAHPSLGTLPQAFQDVARHRYFNTNNLWVRLDKLKESIVAAGGLIPLPMIKNAKTVDPKVIQDVQAQAMLVRYAALLC